MHVGGLYRSKLHVAITLLVVVLPVAFFIALAHFGHLSTATLFADFWRSTFRLLVAYLIAAAIGWLCAVLFYRGRASAVALPTFDVLQSFPTFAAMPIAVTLWGNSDTTIISFLVITIIWPIFFSIVSSLSLIHREWREATQIYNVRGWNYVRRFLWPASQAGLITGSIIGLGEGWEALIATEIIVHTDVGLGEFFTSVNTNPTLTALGIFGFLLVIFSVNKVLWLPLLTRSHARMKE